MGLWDERISGCLPQATGLDGCISILPHQGSEGTMRPDSFILILTHGLKLQPHQPRQRTQAAILGEAQHAIRRRRFHLAALAARYAQLDDAGAVDAVALDALFVARGAVLELRERKVKVRVVVVLPHVRALCRVDNDGAVKDDPDAALGGKDFTRAILEQVVGDFFWATSFEGMFSKALR